MDIERARQAYHALSCNYAASADRGTGAQFAALFDAEGCIISPRGRFTKAEIGDIPDTLRRAYAMTRHEVLNQTLERSDDGTYAGETYGVAHHHQHAGDGPRQVTIWKIRYLDRLRADGDRLLFLHRELVLDWTETHAVNPAGTL